MKRAKRTSSTEVRAEPEDGVVVPVSADGRGAERAGGVDGAVVDGNRDKVRCSDGKTDDDGGDGGDVLVGLSPDTVDSCHDSQDQEESAAEFHAESLPCGRVLVDVVGTAVDLVEENGSHDTDEASAADGAEDLGPGVSKTTDRTNLPCEHEAPRNSRVDVGAGDASKDKDEDSDGVAENQRDLQLSCCADTAVLGEDDAADRAEEEDEGRDKLGDHSLPERDRLDLLAPRRVSRLRTELAHPVSLDLSG